MEEQFNKVAKQGRIFKADVARITEGTSLFGAFFSWSLHASATLWSWHFQCHFIFKFDFFFWSHTSHVLRCLCVGHNMAR